MIIVLLLKSQPENELKAQYNAQGITKNYPQYTTNFWRNSANNYGFGSSNISANIENMQNTTPQIPVATAIPQQQNNMLPNNPVAQQNPLQQVVGAMGDMTTEYFNWHD